MKKFFSIILLLVVLVIGVSGCGTQAQTSGTQANASSGTGRQGQFARPDMMGEVASVTGNDVSLKVIEMPNYGQNNGQGNNGQGSSRNNNQGNGGQGNNNQGNNGQGGQRQGRGNGQNGGQPPQQRPRNYTDETKTITFTKDIPITTSVRTDKGRETKNIAVADLKQGDILQVWYADKDKTTVSKASVMTLGGGGPVGGGGQNGGGQNGNGGQDSGSEQGN